MIGEPARLGFIPTTTFWKRKQEVVRQEATSWKRAIAKGQNFFQTSMPTLATRHSGFYAKPAAKLVSEEKKNTSNPSIGMNGHDDLQSSTGIKISSASLQTTAMMNTCMPAFCHRENATAILSCLFVRVYTTMTSASGTRSVMFQRCHSHCEPARARTSLSFTQKKWRKHKNPSFCMAVATSVIDTPPPPWQQPLLLPSRPITQ